MGTVIANASMSLDGFIAKQDNTIGGLFDWLMNGEVVVPAPAGDITFRLGPVSADYWQGWVGSIGALVCGRTLFDVTDGWSGRHTMDVPVVVVTHRVPEDWVEAHPDAPFTFVTDGVEAAVAEAQEIAGDRTVAITAGTIAGQCLALGLLDEVAIDLVPVVLGGGRPFFGGEAGLPSLEGPLPVERRLGDPTVCVQGDRVTHLRFPVRGAASGSGS